MANAIRLNNRETQAIFKSIKSYSPIPLELIKMYEQRLFSLRRKMNWAEAADGKGKILVTLM